MQLTLMTVPQHTPTNTSDTAGVVANAGLARPPFVYLVSILAGVALHAVWPLPLRTGGVGPLVGPLLVVVGILLFALSVREFRSAGTPVPGNRPVTAIVRSGPYRFTRNPIYMAFSLLHLGIAVWVNSLWVLATLGAALAVISWIVIPREERYLERRFGREYAEYTDSVRRWL